MLSISMMTSSPESEIPRKKLRGRSIRLTQQDVRQAAVSRGLLNGPRYVAFLDRRFNQAVLLRYHQTFLMAAIWPTMATSVSILFQAPSEVTDSVKDMSQRPLAGVVMCCTSIAPEKRVSRHELPKIISHRRIALYADTALRLVRYRCKCIADGCNSQTRPHLRRNTFDSRRHRHTQIQIRSKRATGRQVFASRMGGCRVPLLDGGRGDRC